MESCIYVILNIDLGILSSVDNVILSIGNNCVYDLLLYKVPSNLQKIYVLTVILK